MSGEFKAFRFVNPHSSMKLDVKNADGTTTEWSFVGGSVTSLARLGIGKDGPNALHAGDPITVTLRAGGGRQESDWASGRDHLPGRAHGPFPVPR